METKTSSTTKSLSYEKIFNLTIGKIEFHKKALEKKAIKINAMNLAMIQQLDNLPTWIKQILLGEIKLNKRHYQKIKEGRGWRYSLGGFRRNYSQQGQEGFVKKSKKLLVETIQQKEEIDSRINSLVGRITAMSNQNSFRALRELNRIFLGISKGEIGRGLKPTGKKELILPSEKKVFSKLSSSTETHDIYKSLNSRQIYTTNKGSRNVKESFRTITAAKKWIVKKLESRN